MKKKQTRSRFIRRLGSTPRVLRAVISNPTQGLPRGATGDLGIVYNASSVIFRPDGHSERAFVISEHDIHCPALDHYQL